MKENKTYRIKPECREAFIATDGLNKDILNLIVDAGGYFEVLNISNQNIVDRVRMANGEIYSDDDPYTGTYFELRSDEFKFFEEVTNHDVVLKLEVNIDNAEEMIALIKKIFQ